MVDPTWGNTTGGVDYFDVLDFDHVAFVQRGYDSEYPVPAGGYKYDEDENLKDVNVTFPRRFVKPPDSITIEGDENKKYYSMLPLSTSFTVNNAGQGLLPAQKIVVSNSDLDPKSQAIDIESIPPFGHVDINARYKPLPILTNKTFALTITIAGITLSQSIRVTPLVFSLYAFIGGVFIALLTIIIFIVAKKARRIPVS